PGTATIIGLPGAVEPRSNVTIENTTRGTLVTVLASSDGSFRADLTASPGDVLLVRTTDASNNTGGNTALPVASGLTLPAIANPSAVPGGVTASVTALGVGGLGAAVPAGFTFLSGFTLDLQGQPANAALDVLVESGVPLPAGKQVLLAEAITVQ